MTGADQRTTDPDQRATGLDQRAAGSGRRPRGVRTRLLLVVMVATAVALALMTLAFNLALSRALSLQADALARSRAANEVGSLTIVNGRVVESGRPDPGGLESEAWVFVGDRVVERPNVGPALTAAARRVRTTTGRVVDVPSRRVRLYAMPVSGSVAAVVVAGVSMIPFDKTARVALLGSLVLAVCLLAVVGVVTHWVLAAALRPVARMTADASAWSASDEHRRFAVGEPYDELSQLAATLDRLLDRLSATLRREQRFSAELSHELRTPLAKIRTETELALRRERDGASYRASLQAVHGNALTMARTIETLVAAQRQESGFTSGAVDAATVLDDVATGFAAAAGERGITLEVGAADAGLRIGVDRDVVRRIVEPVVENACRYAKGRVTVKARRSGADVEIVVADDGPGVAADEAERIFEPGVRGSAGEGSGSDSPGAGLGLSLSRRLARAAQGDVTAPAAGPGGVFSVRLPSG